MNVYYQPGVADDKENGGFFENSIYTEQKLEHKLIDHHQNQRQQQSSKVARFSDGALYGFDDKDGEEENAIQKIQNNNNINKEKPHLNDSQQLNQFSNGDLYGFDERENNISNNSNINSKIENQKDKDHQESRNALYEMEDNFNNSNKQNHPQQPAPHRANTKEDYNDNLLYGLEDGSGSSSMEEPLYADTSDNNTDNAYSFVPGEPLYAETPDSNNAISYPLIPGGPLYADTTSNTENTYSMVPDGPLYADSNDIEYAVVNKGNKGPAQSKTYADHLPSTTTSSENVYATTFDVTNTSTHNENNSEDNFYDTLELDRAKLFTTPQSVGLYVNTSFDDGE